MNIHFSKAIVISLLCTSYAPSLSAQDSEAEKSVCEFISKTASELNSSLVFQNLDKDKGSPFVRDYLVQTIIWFEQDNLEQRVSLYPYQGCLLYTSDAADE